MNEIGTAIKAALDAEGAGHQLEAKRQDGNNAPREAGFA